MQWTMWSKSWASKAKGRVTTTARAQLEAGLPKLLGIPTHSRACWNVQTAPRTLNGAGNGSAALWEVSNPKKLSFTLFPTHSVVKSLHYLHPAGPRRGGGEQGNPVPLQGIPRALQPSLLLILPVPKHCLEWFAKLFPNVSPEPSLTACVVVSLSGKRG